MSEIPDKKENLETDYESSFLNPPDFNLNNTCYEAKSPNSDHFWKFG